MGRALCAAMLCAIFIAACGRTVSVERVCELNDEFAALNERTVPEIDNDPFPDPAMLEENFVEGNKLMRQMLDVAPKAIRDDLDTYVQSIEKLSDLYAEFGWDRNDVWSNMDEETYVREYSFEKQVRAGISDWFIEHCGIDLQG